MIRIGFSAWLRDLEKLKDLLSEAANIGLNHVELSIDYPFGFEKPELVVEVCRAVIDMGFTLSIHAPWREIYLASPIPEIRHASINVVKKFIELAGKANVNYVVLHIASDQPYCKTSVPNPCILAAIESLNILIECAENYGTYILVENTSNTPCCGTFNQISYILSQTRAFLCLDIAHAITSDPHYLEMLDRLDYADVVSEWCGSLGAEKIIALHIHGIQKDNGIKVHLDLESIKIDVKKIVKKLHQNLKYVVFEIYRKRDGSKIRLSDLEPYVKSFSSWAVAYGI